MYLYGNINNIRFIFVAQLPTCTYRKFMHHAISTVISLSTSNTLNDIEHVSIRYNINLILYVLCIKV
jgi:hypothetical protein